MGYFEPEVCDMRKLMKPFAMALLAVGIVGGAVAQSHPKANGTVAFDFFGGVANVSFNAHDMGMTGDKGWMDWMTVGGMYPHAFGGMVVNAEVNLLTKEAFFDVLVTYSNPYPFAVGGIIRVSVKDGGTPGRNGDMLGYQWLNVPPFGNGFIGPFPIKSGNLTVH